MTTFAEEMLQQMCGLKGNYAIACPVLDQLAQKVNKSYIRIDTCVNAFIGVYDSFVHVFVHVCVHVIVYRFVMFLYMCLFVNL